MQNQMEKISPALSLSLMRPRMKKAHLRSLIQMLMMKKKIRMNVKSIRRISRA